MKSLIRAVTLVVLLAGIGGLGNTAAAQRGWVDVGISRRPWVRGHVIIGVPRYHYGYDHRPLLVRPHRHGYRAHVRRPLIVTQRFHRGRPIIVHRGHRSHLRAF